MTTTSVLAILSAFASTAPSVDAKAVHAGQSLPEYRVPLEFDPEPGRVNRMEKTRTVRADEFSFMLTGSFVATQVGGFQDDLYGITHDSMVIVRAVEPEDAEDRRPSQWRSDFWNFEGGFENACVADHPERHTGLPMVYSYCDPDPNPNSNFILVDELPDSSEPIPTRRGYVKGVCRTETAVVQPEAGSFTRCRFSRFTDSNERYSFWLKGENLRHLDEVERLIESLLTEWRTD